MSGVKKGGAKEAILSEYERSKKHPDVATMMGGFLFAGDDG